MKIVEVKFNFIQKIKGSKNSGDDRMFSAISAVPA